MAETDILKASIAELLGKKPADLTPGNGPSAYDNWNNYLEAEGYKLDVRPSTVAVKDRHVVLYVDASGQIQGVLSDDRRAQLVDVLTRWTITKAEPKAKDGDKKAA